MNEQQIEKVLEMLMREKFARWYNEGGRFDAFITGDEGAPSRDEIKADLTKLLN